MDKFTFDKSLEDLIDQGFQLAEWLPHYPGHDLFSLSQICADYKLSMFRTVSRGGILLSSEAQSQNYNYSWPGFRHTFGSSNLIDPANSYSDREIIILLFGGSCMHGCYLSDLQTIPSCLYRLLSANPLLRFQPIRILNCSANNWTLENCFAFYRSLYLQGFKADIVISLFGVNDAKNCHWDDDICVLLNKLYIDYVGRDLDELPCFDACLRNDRLGLPYLHTLRDIMLSCQHPGETTLRPLKYVASHISAIDSSFKKYVQVTGASYYSWLQPFPAYESEKSFSSVVCRQSVINNFANIPRISSIYNVFSSFSPSKLSLHREFLHKSTYLDFCHYTAVTCENISKSLARRIQGKLLSLSLRKCFAGNKISSRSLLAQRNTNKVRSSLNSSSGYPFESDTNYPLY